jgi:uncharacterized membrane protein
MAIGAGIGTVAAFWQTLEKLTLIKNPDASLSCNLSGVFSCSNVLNSHQASVFGFPNSIMALSLFLIFFTVGLIGLTGGLVGKYMRFAMQFLSLFTLGFAFWFLFESTYRISSICIFCLFIFGGLLLVNYAWLRQNAPDSKWLKKLTFKGMDVFIWLVCAILVAAAVLFKFYI